MALQLYKPEERITDMDILTSYNVLSLANILRCARMSFFNRLVQKSVQCIINLILCMTRLSSGWAHDLFKDCQWLALHDPFKPIGEMFPEQIGNYIIPDPKSFANNIKKVSNTHFFQFTTGIG